MTGDELHHLAVACDLIRAERGMPEVIFWDLLDAIAAPSRQGASSARHQARRGYGHPGARRERPGRGSA